MSTWIDEECQVLHVSDGVSDRIEEVEYARSFLFSMLFDFMRFGVDTILSGGTSVVFSSGLAATANEVFVTLKSPYQNVGAVTWSAEHPNITVTCETAAEDDQDFSWYAIL